MSTFYVKKTNAAASTLFYICSATGEICVEPTAYLNHKRLQNRSPNTVRGIAYAIVFYLAFLSTRELAVPQVVAMSYIEQIQHFDDYLTWLQSGRHSQTGVPPKNKTCNLYLREIWGFLRFCIVEYELFGELKVLESRLTSCVGAAGVRHTREAEVYTGYLPEEEEEFKGISKEEVQTLVDACTNSRNRVLLRLLAESGFRIGEILGVRYGKDINIDENKVTVVFRNNNINDARAKNCENRSAVVSQDLMDEILLYISENKELLVHSEYLFIVLSGKTKGQPMSAGAVYSMFRSLKDKTGIEAAPHMLRHYFADERRKAGWPLEEIQYALGHKNLSTTRLYLHITDEEQGEASRRYFENYAKTYDIDALI